MAFVSRYEGLPNAVMEAMACGLPRVAVDRPGCAELVSHQETGLVVKPEDAPALAEALLKLMREPSVARRYGMAGRDYVTSKLSIEKMVSETTEIYERYLRSEI